MGWCLRHFHKKTTKKEKRDTEENTETGIKTQKQESKEFVNERKRQAGICPHKRRKRQESVTEEELSRKEPVHTRNFPGSRKHTGKQKPVHKKTKRHRGTNEVNTVLYTASTLMRDDQMRDVYGST